VTTAGQPQILGGLATITALRAGHRLPLRCPAHHRYFRSARIATWARSTMTFRNNSTHSRASCLRAPTSSSAAGADHDGPRTVDWPSVSPARSSSCTCLIVINFSRAGSVHHHHGIAGRPRGYRLIAADHGHDSERAGITGAIMCMVLQLPTVSWWSARRDRMNQGATALQAAHDAAFTRFRPVLMTALAWASACCRCHWAWARA